MGIDVTTTLGMLRGVFFVFWFFIAVILGLYLPGRLIFRNFAKGISFFRRTVMYVGIGMALWIIQGYIFGQFHIRYASYLYLVVMLLFSVFTIKKIPQIKAKTLVRTGKAYWWIILLFLLGVTIQTIQAVPSGFIFADGWHTFIADDALWHFGMTGELIKHMPPNEPGTTGVVLTNYHYLGNLFIADFARVFNFPLLTVQFFFVYVLLSSMLGLLLFTLGRTVGLSLWVSTLIMYFQYFASDVIYMIPMFTRHVLDFTVHPLEDGTMLLENPPRAFASVFTVLGILLLFQASRSKKVFVSVLTGLVFGLVIGCKVHSGIMVLMGLAGVGIYALLKRKWTVALAPVIALLTSIIIYVPTNSGAGGPLFSPFEMARMFASQPRLAISFFELRRVIFAAHNNFLRVSEMNILMLIIFYLAQFGFRTIGWFGIVRAKKIFGIEVAIFCIAALVGTTAFATLYIQPITFADIFNSYLAASVILSILSGVTIEWLLYRKKKTVIVMCLMLIGILTVPRISYRMIEFAKKTFQSVPVISKSEIETMDFVRNHVVSEKTMYVFNYAKMDGFSSYVSGYTKKDTFLAGQVILTRHGVQYSERQALADIIATSEDSASVSAILANYDIGFLYAYKPFLLPSGLKQLDIKKIFENDTNIVYRYK
jgi:hypothetical protein